MFGNTVRSVEGCGGEGGAAPRGGEGPARLYTSGAQDSAYLAVCLLSVRVLLARKSVCRLVEKFLSLKKTKSPLSVIPASTNECRKISLEFGAFGVLNYRCYPSHHPHTPTRPNNPASKMMAVAAAQKNREMFAIKKSYSIEGAEIRLRGDVLLAPPSDKPPSASCLGLFTGCGFWCPANHPIEVGWGRVWKNYVKNNTFIARISLPALDERAPFLVTRTVRLGNDNLHQQNIECAPA
ncbi:hypothetical protein J6590_068138 [Homalodisca vitripennis]|nr:hypothetical protein J6590_068138 [Homalodisca vitripennis]